MALNFLVFFPFIAFHRPGAYVYYVIVGSTGHILKRVTSNELCI